MLIFSSPLTAFVGSKYFQPDNFNKVYHISCRKSSLRVSIPELVDAYENDILFAFRGLLNEQAGANIRNRIAHGMIEEAECSSGEFLYFGAAVIKILSFTVNRGRR